MGSQTFDSTDSWEVPAGVTEVIVKAWGAGGSGGLGPSGAVTFSGGGGGGGGFSQGTVQVTPGEIYPVTVGEGGDTGAFGGRSEFIGEEGIVIARGGNGGGSSSTSGASGGPAFANEVVNPSAEVNSTNYAAISDATIERSSEEAYDGSWSIKVNRGNTGSTTSGVSYTETTLVASTNYWVWVWVKIIGSSETLQLRVRNQADTANLATKSFSISPSDGWKPVLLAFTTDAGQTALRWNIVNTGSTSMTYYVDFVRVFRAVDSVGDTTFAGGNGGDGCSAGSRGGAGGGGSAGDSAIGNNGSSGSSNCTSGAAGGSGGTGGSTGGGNGGTGGQFSGSAPQPGVAPGGGGGGASSSSNSVGVGAVGKIILEWEDPASVPIFANYYRQLRVA